MTGERVISALRKPISSASFVKANKYLSGDFLPGCQAVAGGCCHQTSERFGLQREDVAKQSIPQCEYFTQDIIMVSDLCFKQMY